MTTQSWIIGSQPDCQLVVHHPTVSGEHCRLTADGHTFLLEDLDSTNGTYVNGERLTALREVRRSDRITLGKTHQMPWPVDFKPAGKTIEDLNPIEISGDTYAISGTDPRTARPDAVITIGRGPQNSVVLSDSNISTQHARLTVTPDQIILEDLGSTNGTSVGTVENKIHRAEIHEDDTVYFGSTSFSVADLLQRHNAAKAAVRAQSKRPAAETAASKPLVPVPVWIAGSLGTAAILLIGWIIFGRSDAETPADAAGTEAATGRDNAEAVRDVSVKAAPLMSEEERLSRSLFVIVASDAERKTPFRVGTGFAVDSRHVATTASVVSALHKLQESGYPETFLYCPATGQELEIAGMRVHPGFQSADAAAKSAQDEYESVMEQYEIEPPSPENLETVKSKLLSAQERAFQSFERKTTFDAAVIQSSQSLKYWLAGAEPGTPVRPNLKLNVRGLAHDVEDPFYDPQSMGEPAAMTSRVRQMTRDFPPRLLVEAGPQQRDYAWFGSPVLNARGKVVAVYSRPTPPATEAESADPPPTFDAPLFDRVRECLPEKP